MEEVVVESDRDPVLPDSVVADNFIGVKAGELPELLRFFREILFFGASSGGLSSITSLVELTLSKSPIKTKRRPFKRNYDE